MYYSSVRAPPREVLHGHARAHRPLRGHVAGASAVLVCYMLDEMMVW